jgi:hypothetical protein
MKIATGISRKAQTWYNLPEQQRAHVIRHGRIFDRPALGHWRCYEIDRRMGGTGMRLVLTIIASLVLAGCAGTYDKLADANLCEPSIPASLGVTSQFFPSSSLTVPARSLLGSGKTDPDDTMTYACIDPKGNKMNAPEVPNLHKIKLPRLSAAI